MWTAFGIIICLVSALAAAFAAGEARIGLTMIFAAGALANGGALLLARGI